MWKAAAVGAALLFLPLTSFAVPASEPVEYVACGCGCCGGIGDKNRKTECVPDKAALQEIIRRDEETRHNPQCAVMGCAPGTHYRICRQKNKGENNYLPLGKGINLSNWLANAERQPIYARDFQQIKKAGFDHVRLPVKPELLSRDYTAVDNAMQLALKNHLRVVLDLHPKEPYVRALETEASADESFIRLWVNAARHYRGISHDQLAFELLNEPQYYEMESRYNNLIAKTVAAIRQEDPDRILIIGAPRGSSLDGLLKLHPLKDNKIIYAFHFYEPVMFTHQGVHRGFDKKMLRWFHDVPYPSAQVDKAAAVYAEHAPDPAQAQQELEEYVKADWNRKLIAERLQIAKEWADNHHVPVICGEFGVLRTHADEASRYRWIKDTRESLEKLHIGWELWDYTDLMGITRLEGKTSTDKGDGSVRLVEPEKGTRIIESEAKSALGLH